jgi:hypothetical protein
MATPFVTMPRSQNKCPCASGGTLNLLLKCDLMCRPCIIVFHFLCATQHIFKGKKWKKRGLVFWKWNAYQNEMNILEMILISKPERSCFITCLLCPSREKKTFLPMLYTYSKAQGWGHSQNKAPMTRCDSWLESSPHNWGMLCTCGFIMHTTWKLSSTKIYVYGEV